MFAKSTNCTIRAQPRYPLRSPKKHVISAQDPGPDPLDPQDFGFLDPEKYADPRIQGAKYQPKMEEKKITPKTQI